MVLFTDYSAAYIIAKRKWQTRRLWKKPRVRAGGKYYCQLNLRKESRFATIRVISIEEWDGKTISKEDAIAEGYDTPEDFMEVYRELNAHNWEDETRTHYAIEFEVLEILPCIPEVPPLSFFLLNELR